MYIAIYKCRLCGKEISKEEYESEAQIEEIKFSKEWSRVWIDHKCEDGGIGIADAIGFKKLTDNI